MRNLKRNPLLLMGAVLVAVQGCANYPISEPFRTQASPLPIGQALQNPNAAKGMLVIWGGRILRTANDPNGSRIYVLELPLDSEERPRENAASGGRFIIRSASFLDPEVYKADRLVTLAGEITGVQAEPIDKLQYTYVVLTIREIHVWRRVPAYEPYPGPWGWRWGGWRAYPGWYW